ncbi:MAG: hypothetical protein KDA75_05005 [Planctomycetaceae bacterium]|nr:hypothetical protein [Planctomycetaceae bacterium]
MPTRYILCWLFLVGLAVDLAAAEPKSSSPTEAPAAADSAPAEPQGPTPLNKSGTVMIDSAGHRLILKSQVVLRAGLLEMLLCKAQTKEHESILAIDADAYVIHAGLLALGAEVGSPVRFDPEFQPPQGTKIKIQLRWKDEEGKQHTEKAQNWIRHAVYRFYSSPLSQLPQGFQLPKESELRYDEQNGELIWYGPMTSAQRDDLMSLSQDAQYRKGIEHFYQQSQFRPLEADWVFAGSGFWVQADGKRIYQAEEGNVICVANFGDAMLDIAVASTASNDGLQFEPWTEHIPPIGTDVEVDLIPVLEANAATDSESETPQEKPERP